jgi:hypothetical protein
MLQHIRSKKDSASLLEFLQTHKGTTTSTEIGQMPWQELGLTAQQIVSAQSHSGESLNTLLSNNATAENERIPHQSREDMITRGENAIINVLSQSHVASALSLGIQSFNHYTGSIFFISELAETDVLVQNILNEIDTQQLGWLRNENDHEISRKKTLLSEMCGMAAVGLQYNSETLDAEYPISTDLLYGFDGCQLSKMFYGIAKIFLDEAIETNPYRSMRICALLAIFNIIEHSSVAVAYNGLYLFPLSFQFTRFDVLFALDAQG